MNNNTHNISKINNLLSHTNIYHH